MSEDKKTSDLIDKIVTQTNLSSDIVKAFVNQLFKEMEKELISTTHLKVDGLGVFRLMKSGDSRKVLFLSKFKSETSALAKDNRIKIDEVNVAVKNPKNDIKKDIIASDPPKLEKKKEEPSNTTTSKDDFLLETNSGDALSSEKENKGLTSKVSTLQHNPTEEERKEAEYIPANDEAYLDGLVQENDDAFQGFEERTALGGQFDDSFFDEYQDYESDSKKQSKRKIWLVIASVVAIVALVLFFALRPEKIKDPLPPKANINVPSYTKLDNPDSLKYIDVIIAENNLDFATLSQLYYGNEIFWPYIYKANKVDIAEPLEIKAGTMIYIPRVATKLLDPNSSESIDSVRYLVNEMIKMRSTAVSTSPIVDKDSLERE